MTHLAHVAIWTRDLPGLRDFYCLWFAAVANEGYHNPRRQFRSHFLTFSAGARLELMSTAPLADAPAAPAAGYAHIAIALGSEAAVDGLVARMKDAGVTIVDGPRRTGDGFYEAVVLDPDGNRVELTV